VSLVSNFDVSDGSMLMRHFIAQVLSYFDRPECALTNVAKIPLENVFRMLEMFRYDAFSTVNPDWAAKVTRGLTKALVLHYPGVPKEEAVRELQDAVVGLSTNLALDKDLVVRTKACLSTAYSFLI
jgi:hypothetical protein